MSDTESKSNTSFLRRLVQPQSDGGIQPIVIIGTFILFFALGMIFPYTGDDWTWGSYVGLGRMENDFFAHYNGRYVGNLCVLALTRVLWLKALAVAASCTYIVYGGYRFAGKKHRWVYWMMLALILFMQHELRSEGIVWTAGFANYALPMAGFFAWMNIFKDVFTDDYQPLRKGWMLPLALFGFVLCLFLETITLCTVISSAALVIYVRIRHKRIDGAQVAFLVGAIAGTALMFANETYHDPNAFHSMAVWSSLYSIARTYGGKVGYEGYAQNMALNVTFALIAVLAAKYRVGANERTHKHTQTVMAVIAVLLACYSTLRAITCASGNAWRITDGILALVFLAIACKMAAMYWKSLHDHRPLFCLAVAFTLTAPLLVVSPVTWRCFFPEYLLLAVYMCVLAIPVREAAGIGENVVTRVCQVLCVAGFVMWFVIYGTVYSVYCHRGDDIRRQLDAGQTTIYLERLPFARHIQHNDSIIESNEYQMRDRFFIYYNIPKGCTVVFVDHPIDE